MLRVHCSGGMYFAGLTTERFQAARQRLAAQRKILICRGRMGGCIQTEALGQENEPSDAGCSAVRKTHIPRL
jgi:hypothetical protein